MGKKKVKGLIAALTDPPGADGRKLEEAVAAMLEPRRALAPEEARRLLADIVREFEDYAARNRGRLHLSGKPALVEEAADLMRAAARAGSDAPVPVTKPKAPRGRSRTESAVLAHKERFALYSALVRDAKLPETVRRELLTVLARYYDSGLPPEHRLALGFFFSRKPFGRYGNPEHFAVFKRVREAKAQMWALLGQAGLAGAPRFLDRVAGRAALKAADTAWGVLREAGKGSARSRAATLWGRIERRLAAAPPDLIPDAALRQDMAELTALAMTVPGGAEAIRRRLRIALRHEFGAMRQRWLDALMDPAQARLRGELAAMGIGFKAAHDTSRGRRIFVEISHDGPPVRVGIDLDHADIGFAEARDRFIDAFLADGTLSTDALRPIFDPDNLVPLLPLENSGMIEVLRRDVRDLEAGIVGGRPAVVSPILPADELLGQVREPELVRAEFMALRRQAKEVDALRAAARRTRAQLDLLPEGPARQELIDDFEGIAFGFDL